MTRDTSPIPKQVEEHTRFSIRESQYHQVVTLNIEYSSSKSSKSLLYSLMPKTTNRFGGKVTLYVPSTNSYLMAH